MVAIFGCQFGLELSFLLLLPCYQLLLTFLELLALLFDFLALLGLLLVDLLRILLFTQELLHIEFRFFALLGGMVSVGSTVFSSIRVLALLTGLALVLVPEYFDKPIVEDNLG